MTELNWSRTNKAAKIDGARHYFVNKGLKDYIIETNKTEFTYDEIKEMFDDGSVLNYINELVMLKLRDWRDFLDLQLCEGSPGECPRTEHREDDRQALLNFYPFIGEQIFIQEFFTKGQSTDLMYEDLMKFWEWESERHGYHIFKAEAHEYNGSLDYFRTPEHVRDQPLRFAFQLEPPDELFVRVIRRSHLNDAPQLPKLLRFPTLDRPTKLALHVSASLAQHPESYLGHDRYRYNGGTSGLSSEALWVDLKEDYMTHFKQRTTQAGMPRCLYDRIQEMAFEEQRWVRCPVAEQVGFGQPFLRELGLTQDVIGQDLVFKMMVVF